MSAAQRLENPRAVTPVSKTGLHCGVVAQVSVKLAAAVTPVSKTGLHCGTLGTIRGALNCYGHPGLQDRAPLRPHDVGGLACGVAASPRSPRPGSIAADRRSTPPRRPDPSPRSPRPG